MRRWHLRSRLAILADETPPDTVWVAKTFDRFAGNWLITEHQGNGAAVKFWRGVVSAYTRGKYQERVVNGEVQQHFVSGSQRR